MRVFKSLWHEILTPSPPGETAYLWAVIAIGHAALGAFFYVLFEVAADLMGGVAFPVSVLVISVVYWLLKERADLYRGGTWRDGLTDTFFVALGAFYGPWWWPLAVFGAVIAGLTFRALLPP